MGTRLGIRATVSLMLALLLSGVVGAEVTVSVDAARKVGTVPRTCSAPTSDPTCRALRRCSPVRPQPARIESHPHRIQV